MGTAKKTHLRQMFFSCKTFWHFLNSQLVQTNWLLGLHCASCFGTEDCLPKSVQTAQPFGMRGATLQLQIADGRCHQQGGNQLPDCHLFLHRWPASKVAILRSLTRVYWRLQGVSVGPNGTFLHTAGMRSGALYTRKKNTCLRIFRLLMAQRATGQRRTLVQV